MHRASVRTAVLASLVCLLPASRGDTVFLVSFTTGELVRYDSNDPAGTRVVLTGSGTLVRPAALAVGPDGNVYVGEDGDGAAVPPRITRYTTTTGSLTPVHTFAAFDVLPGSLAFRGSDLLVGRNPLFANTGPVVRVADATGGGGVAAAYTTGGGLASSPGLAVAASGDLYVADQTYDFGSGIASGPVKRFDAAGIYAGEVIAGGSSGTFGPTGLAIRGTTLFTANIMAGTVLRTDLAGPATTVFASAGGPFEVGAIALLADGGLLAGSPSGSGAVYRFGPDGALLGTYASGLGQIGGIATVAAVPEPAGAALAAAGVSTVLGIGIRVRRRSRT